MKTPSKNLQAELQKLALEHGIDLNKVELSNTDLELVRGGLGGFGNLGFGFGPGGGGGSGNFGFFK